MERLWITNGSTSVAPVVNSVSAACREGFVPTDVRLLSNPTIADVTDRAVTQLKTVVTAHGGDEPAVTVEPIEDETDFEAIVATVQEAIAEGRAAGAAVAVDLTPGRKFWSSLSFQAGIDADVDHLYYLHVDTGEYYGQPEPLLPRTAVDLVDFTEVW